MKTLAVRVGIVSLIVLSHLPASAQCVPLPGDDVLATCVIGNLFPTVELTPGYAADLAVFYRSGPGGFEQLRQCITWSIDPPGPVEIDAVSGHVVARADAQPGFVFRVIAVLAGGRRVIAAPGLVYDATAHPIVGLWTETERRDCRSGQVVTPTDPIRELAIRADGSIFVTRMPFESAMDYWGRYVADERTHRLLFTIDGGNIIPEHVGTYGHYKIDDQGRLILDGIALGKFDADRRRACYYVFRHLYGGSN
jgi:hypothetical protein